MRKFQPDHGAAAVEFALILVPLLVLLLGIIEFGYVFNQQLTVTNAAREGARVLAITRSASDATLAAGNAASSLNGTPVITTPQVCPATGPGNAEVRVVLDLELITGIDAWVPGLSSMTLMGRAVTPCGG